jgi:Alanine racemase, N-terminal domain
MPLTLYVDHEAWHQHLKAKVAEDPGLVPVAKGNGYGFTVPLLARTAAGLGVERIAVGSAQDATAVLPVFPGEILILDSPAGACPPPAPPGAGRRVLYTAASVPAVSALAGRRLVVECRSSLRRQGIAVSELAEVRALAGGRGIEGFSLHLPIDRPPGAEPVTETARWVQALAGAGYQVPVMYVSHLLRAELAELTRAFPATSFRLRAGTCLWLGQRSACHAAATVLQVFPVRRGERVGYRQHRSAHEGWLVVVAGGTAHGVGLEAPRAVRGLAPRARTLARSGLAAANRFRSPFSWAGRKQWFAEPPHMLVSMLLLPRGVRPPVPGAELAADLRYTATHFDRIVTC